MENTLPIGAKPYTNQLYLDLDGNIWGGNINEGYNILYTSDQVDLKILDEANIREYNDNSLDAKKANALDIFNPVTIAFGDANLSGLNYTNIALSGKTVPILYTDENGSHFSYITFNGGGVAVLPVAPISGNNASNILLIGETGSISNFNNFILQNFSLVTNRNIVGKTFTTPPSYLDTVPVFSGWDVPIGSPQNISGLNHFIRTRANILTRERITIYEEGNPSNVIYTINRTGLSLSANTAHTIVVDFGFTYVNAGSLKLRLAYECDVLIDRYGLDPTGGGAVFPQPTYNPAKYVANGSFTGSWTLPVDQNSPQNRADYIEFYLTTTQYEPKQKLADEIADLIPGLTDLERTTEKVNDALEYHEVFIGTPLFSSSLASWFGGATTVRGWGWSLGLQSGNTFNAIPFITRAKFGTSNITNTIWELREDNRTGVLVESGVVNQNFGYSAEGTRLIAKLATTIVNTSNKKYWFGYKCNGNIDIFGIVPGLYIAPSYGQSAYVTDGSPTNWQTSSPDTYNSWCEVGMISEAISPTNEFKEQLQKELPYCNILINSVLTATLGKQKNIYFRDLFISNLSLNQLEINIDCIRGVQYADFYRLEPNGTVENVPFKISISFNGLLLASKLCTLYITNNTVTAKTINLNVFADSLVNNSLGGFLNAIYNEQSGYNLKVAFRGTRVDAGINHQALAGGKIEHIATYGIMQSIFTVSGVSVNPSIGAFYVNNQSTFSVTAINITGGTGTITATRIGGANAPSASGSLAKNSGTGDTNIAFSSVVNSSLNEVWNNTTNQLDYGNYNTTKIGGVMSSGDGILLAYGINDIFQYLTDAEVLAVIPTIIANYRAFIANANTAINGLRYFITLPPAPVSSQDGFAVFYLNCAQNLDRYKRNWKLLINAMINSFDNDIDRGNNIHLIEFCCSSDTVNNWSKASAVNINSRNTDTVSYPNDSVHGGIKVYNQLSDALLSKIRQLN